jgi:hypothetical protein
MGLPGVLGVGLSLPASLPGFFYVSFMALCYTAEKAVTVCCCTDTWRGSVRQ